jgi:hypothetical protein
MHREAKIEAKDDMVYEGLARKHVVERCEGRRKADVRNSIT